MSRVRVYIVTSEGPVRIQAIRAEEAVDEMDRCAVCLNGTHSRLAISKGYHYFVRDHVRQLAGQAHFRMDLDGRVDVGNSWMLGAWIAHLLLHADRLAMHDEDAGLTVFATGEIAFGAGAGRRVEVRKVGHIPDKVRLMAERVAEEAAEGRRVLFLAPRDNAEEAKTAIEALAPAVRECFSFHGIADGDEIGALAPLATEKTSPPVPSLSELADPGAAPRRRRAPLVFALVALIAGGGAAGGYLTWRGFDEAWQVLWQQGRYADLVAALEAAPFDFMAARFRSELRAQSLAAPGITVFARRPDDGGSCAGLRFRKGRIVDMPAPPPTGNKFALDNPRTLCGFVVRAGAAEMPATGILWLAVYRDGEGAREAILPARRGAFGNAANGSVAIAQDLPLYRHLSWSWRVLAIRTPGPSADLEKMFGNKGTGLSADALGRIAMLGIPVTRARVDLASPTGGLDPSRLNHGRR